MSTKLLAAYNSAFRGREGNPESTIILSYTELEASLGYSVSKKENKASQPKKEAIEDIQGQVCPVLNFPRF